MIENRTYTLTRDRPREGEEDSYAGTLRVSLALAMDDADEAIYSLHGLARLILTMADSPLSPS